MGASENNQTDYICPFLDQCAFIESHQAKMPELVQRIRKDYCTNEAAECARRQIYETLGADAVPSLMLPGQSEWACQITIETDDDKKVSKKVSKKAGEEVGDDNGAVAEAAEVQ